MLLFAQTSTTGFPVTSLPNCLRIPRANPSKVSLLRCAAGNNDEFESGDTPMLAALRKVLKQEYDEFTAIRYASIPKKEQLASLKLMFEPVLKRYKALFSDYISDEAAVYVNRVMLQIYINETITTFSKLSIQRSYNDKRFSEICATRSFSKRLDDLMTTLAAIKDNNCEALLKEKHGKSSQEQDMERITACVNMVAEYEAMIYELVTWDGLSDFNLVVQLLLHFIHALEADIKAEEKE